MPLGQGTSRPLQNLNFEQFKQWCQKNWPWRATAGAKLITADEIKAGTITGTEIAANTISTSHLNFTVEGATVNEDNIIATINASTEGGLQITGAKIAISGSTTFASGYDPTTKLGSGSAAADVNSNTTTINGAKISTGTITANQIAADAITAEKIDVSTLSAISADLGTVTAGSITGATVTGGTVQTATAGTNPRFVINGSSAIQYGSDGLAKFTTLSAGVTSCAHLDVDICDPGAVNVGWEGSGNISFGPGMIGTAGTDYTYVDATSVKAPEGVFTSSKATKFYIGSTEVLVKQGAAVADATGLGDVVTIVNTILSRLREIKLLGT